MVTRECCRWSGDPFFPRIIQNDMPVISKCACTGNSCAFEKTMCSTSVLFYIFVATGSRFDLMMFAYLMCS